MKTILKFSLLLGLLISLGSCEATKDADPATFQGPHFVAFTSSSNFSVAEFGNSIFTIDVGLSQAQTSDVTVNYTLTPTNATEGVDYDYTGSRDIVIPAGDFVGSVELQVFDDNIFNGVRTLVFELTGVSGGGNGLEIGLVEDGSRIKSVNITDDDCPVAINDWVGTYTVDEMFTSGVNAPLGLADFFGETYQIELSLMPGDLTGTKVLINNSAGYNEYIPDGTVMTFDACPGNIVFDAGPPLLALFRNFEFDTAVYDESDFTIQANGPLATFGPYQFLFTKQ